MDFTTYFEKYEALAAKVEEAFKRVDAAHPGLVKCKPGCTDCCFALFDLTLVEALYLNQKFNEKFEGENFELIIEKANKADRQIYKLKKAAYQSAQDGTDEDAVVEEMGKKRIRCPLLNDDNLCALYENRPLACRIYGVPLAIGGTGRTCGFSGFVKGEKYPTVNMDIIQNQLIAISTELALSLESKHPGLSEILVPVSMAILTNYDDEYLGTVKRELKNFETS
jgi:Fe-S-cluster containining protein